MQQQQISLRKVDSVIALLQSPSMATHINLCFTIFILLIISANGRRSGGNAKLRAVSRAASSYVTNYTDVLGLGVLVNQYSIYESTEDPCVAPVWSWIECNNDSTPRVIAVNLHSEFLVYIPEDFSAMDALQTIDLSDASISGSIPSFFGNFPVLEELNLANNNFEGAVPASLCKNKKLKLTLFGNSGLSSCSSSSSNKSPSSPVADDLNGSGGGGGGGGGGGSGSTNIPPTTRPKQKSNTPAIVGGTISALLVLFLAGGGFAIHRQRAKTAAAVAAVSAVAVPGFTDPKANVPSEEVPMKTRPDYATP